MALPSSRQPLDTGVPGLNAILGGGIAPGDLMLVVGAPGAGKTTLSFQVAFNMARAGKTVLFISTLSEPVARLVGHFRGYTFWDEALLGRTLHLRDIYSELNAGIERLLQVTVDAVKAHGASLLVLDGLMTIRDLQPASPRLDSFVHELGRALLAVGCTGIVTSSGSAKLTGQTPPEFTMCDSMVELAQEDSGYKTRRTIRAWKVRGASSLLGRHTFRIDSSGIIVFPRVETLPIPDHSEPSARRCSTGAAELDAMMGGGVPAGSATIVAGAPGTGKTQLAVQFLMEGLKQGERGLFLGFQEPLSQLLDRARRIDAQLLEDALSTNGTTFERRSPVQLDIDELLSDLFERMRSQGVQRLVIDGLDDLERAIPDEDRRRDVLVQLNDFLQARGVTTFFTKETAPGTGPELAFSSSDVGVLGENVVLLRRVAFGGELTCIISVLKMRQSAHDRSIRQFVMTQRGLEIRAPLESPEGLLSGIATLPSEQRVKPKDLAGPRVPRE